MRSLRPACAQTTDEQGQSSFVWSVIGAISQVTSLPVTTSVTCPTTRIHPAIIAQAAATASLLTDGKFSLGVGTGEALNEHVTGAKWPAAEKRQDMLEEAVTIINELLTGEGAWAPDTDQARKAMHRLWATDSIPGESAQLLPLPRHFAQVAQLVTEDMISAPCGPDPAPYLEAIEAYEEAGFDEVYLGQVGGRLEDAFEFFASQVLPRARG
jgi:hypothetical protein